MIRLAGALLGLLLLLPDAAAAGADRFALVVGANQGGPGYAQLFYSEADARRVSDVLAQLGSVPEQNTALLLTPTVAQVRGALSRLQDDITEARAAGSEHVTVLFFYSGHADPDALRLGRGTLSFDDLKASLEQTGADVRLLFIDSCYAGGATRSKGASRAPGFLRDASAQVDARGEVVITSSAADEASQESDEVGGSYFTHYLLSGLRGDADADADGEVTLDEAYRYVFHRTVAHTAGTRAGAQHPGFDYDLSGSGDLVLTQLESKGAALRFDASQAGRFLVFDDERREFVAEVQATPGRPTRLLVDAGRYRVQLRAPDALFEQQLRLRDGDEGAVDREVMAQIPYSEDTTKGAILRVRRQAAGKEVTLGAKVSVQGFFDPAIRETLVPPMVLGGAELDLRGLAAPWLAVRAELLVGGRRFSAVVGSGAGFDADYFQLLGGLGAYFVPEVPGARWLRPFVGVRLAVMWVQRTFLPFGIMDDQFYVGGAPGVSGGLDLRWSARSGLRLEGRAHGSFWATEDKQQVQGYAEGLASIWFAL